MAKKWAVMIGRLLVCLLLLRSFIMTGCSTKEMTPKQAETFYAVG
jgi:uncharacterized integral membrane protein